MTTSALQIWARFVQMQCAHVQQSYELRAHNIRGWTLLYLAVRRTGGPRQCVILGSTFCPAQNLIENSKLLCSAELQVTYEQRLTANSTAILLGICTDTDLYLEFGEQVFIYAG